MLSIPSYPALLAPAQIGARLEEVDTPALLIDLDALASNVAQLHAYAHAAGVRVRPHAKAHKSPDIARLQLAAGAQGICCQKLGEAEVFADAGIDDILVTNELVGRAKAERAARLAARIRLGVCVDHPLQVRQLGEAARAGGSRIDVLIEVDVGQGRCGVESPEQALALAQEIAAFAPALRLAGLHVYHGSAQHLRTPAERASAIADACERTRAVLALLTAQGFECPTITGAGTGSYGLEAASGLYTELQPGSYVLMDTDYAANQPDPAWPAMRHALFGWCSVISRRASHAVLDGGLKAFATDHGLPRVLLEGWQVESLSDEHTVIVPGAKARPLTVGDKVRLLPGHCDPTVNLHDWLVALRSDRVEELWPVAARGALR